MSMLRSGRTTAGLWIAAVVLALGATANRSESGEPKKVDKTDTDGPRKVLARTEDWSALGMAPAELLLIARSEDQLMAGVLGKKAQEKEARERLLASLTKALGVKAIDWDSQMLVIVGNGPDINPTARRSIHVGALEAKGGSLTIPVRLTRIAPKPRPGDKAPPPGAAAPCPVLILLIERFRGPCRPAVQQVVGG